MDNRQLSNLCFEILEEGRRRFGMMMGIVSRIDGETYGVFAVSSLTGIPGVGDQYALNAVYCREVCEHGKTVAVTEIDGTPGMRLHPLYDAVPCEAYISSPIFVDGKVWGTLNFTSLEKRDTPFSADDISFNEHQAAKISSAIVEAGTE